VTVDEIHQRVVSFFDDFNAAFLTFDGDRVAAKFSLPFLARNSDGLSTIFDNRADVARYFQTYLDEYQAKDCRQCRYSELQVVVLGKGAAVASVRWSLLNDAKAAVLDWRESYLLSIDPDMPMAFATIDHV
jgi:hypothetical protein